MVSTRLIYIPASMAPCSAAPGAGEKFVSWLKSCKQMPFGKCLKKIISRKTPRKIRRKYVPGKPALQLAPSLLNARECQTQPTTVEFYLPVGTGGSGIA